MTNVDRTGRFGLRTFLALADSLREKRTSRGGVSAFLALCVVLALQSAPVEFKKRAKKIDVAIGGKLFTAYSFDEAIAKPYLTSLRTASGLVISRSFPVSNHVTVADEKTSYFEPHQRPLYFEHGDVDGLNFWAEETFGKYYHGHSRQAYGRMSFVKMEAAEEGADAGTIRARFHLLDPAQRVIAEETQSFVFHGDNHTRTIDCEFIVEANHGPVTWGDTKEGTFALRLGAELSAPHVRMLNSNGAEGEAAIWGKTADWVNYSGKIAGSPVNVAVFESPDSFRHPTAWHARAYGLLAANPFGLREFSNDPTKDGSWTVPEGKSIRFRYRVLIHEGKLSPAELGNLYRRYTGVK